MSSRRKFLKLLSAASAASAIIPALPAPTPEKISVEKGSIHGRLTRQQQMIVDAFNLPDAEFRRKWDRQKW